MTFPGTPKSGLKGTLTALIDPAADRMSGTTFSNTGDSGSWTGTRTLCPAL
jgi:hypothetical protein